MRDVPAARLTVCAPLRLEALIARPARASGGADADWTTVRVGMGPARARAATATLPDFDALAVVGAGGALVPGLRPGDLFVATEVRSGDVRVPCGGAPLLLWLLVEAGLPAYGGPLVTHDRVVHGKERARLASATGALAVDMESVPLALAARGRPFVVLRAIVDTPERPLARPGTLYRGPLALHRLRRAVPLLLPWAATSTGRPATSPAREVT